MKMKLIYLLAFLSAGVSCDSLLTSQAEAAEEWEIVGRHPGWQQAAASWGMDLKTFREEADKEFARLQESGERIGYDDLVAVLNPYASLYPAVEQHLIASLGSPQAYMEFRAAEEKKLHKFTIAR